MNNNDRNEIVFGARDQEFFELSPYYFCTFEIGGKRWRTLIHYWVSIPLNDSDLRENIRTTDSIEMAVFKARSVGFTSIDNFDEDQMKMVIKSVYERIRQNDGIKRVLLCTGNYDLIYCSRDSTLLGGDGNKYGKLITSMRGLFEG